MRKTSRVPSQLFVMVIVLSLTFGACGGQKELDTPETPSGGSPPATQIEDPSQQAGFEEGELPDDFPEEFPLPEDFKVGSSVNLEKGAFRVFLSLQGTLEEALTFFREELPAAGWTITGESEIQGNPTFDLTGQEYAGELVFIPGELGVVLEVHLFPAESAQEGPAPPENMGESTTLGSGESDFPEDFPLPASFQPVQISSTLAEKGYQLTFSYQGMPELALTDLTMALINGGWTVGDPSLEGTQHAYRLPFEDPSSGFQGQALISNDPAVVGGESQNLTIIAFQSGE